MRRPRSDRRASRRLGLAGILLRLGDDVVWIAFLTGVPVALVDMLADELRGTPAGAETAPRSRGRRLADTATQLLAVACIGACVVAVIEHAVVLSILAAAAAVTAFARRPLKLSAARRAGLPARGQPAPPGRRD